MDKKRLEDLLVRKARQLTHASPTGRWKLTELGQALRDSGVEIDRLESGRRLLRRPMEEGRIVMFKGGRSASYTCPVHQQTLEDLLKRAKGEIDPDLTLKPGRRTRKKDTRAVEAINPKHFERIRTACRAVAKHLHPEAKSSQLDAKIAAVGSEYFVWNEQNEDWSAFLELVRDACQNKSKSTQRQYVSSARRLLDLAATHGWISKTALHDRDYEPVPSDWADLFNEWRDHLMGCGTPRLRSSLITLFEACAQCGFHPTEADWDEVIDHLEKQFRAGNWETSVSKRVRALYRHMREIEMVEGPNWDGRIRQHQAATALVRNSAAEEAGNNYGRYKNPDVKSPAVQAALEGRELEWPGEFSRFKNGLLSGPYGLKTALTFFSLTGSEAEIVGLPHRVFPREQIRAPHPKQKRAWTTVTAQSNLKTLLHAAGWMAENLDHVDWSEDDLRTLVKLDNLKAYRRAVYAGQLSTRRSLRRRIVALARIASPFLEAMALKHNNEELADEMAKVSATLSSEKVIDGRVSWRNSLNAEINADRTETQKKRAEKIESVWTRNGQAAEYAYLQFRRVREGLLELLERDYGPLADQIEAIHSKQSFDRSWALKVQEALLWQEQTVVPLRAATLGLLDMEDRLHTPDLSRIWAEIPAWKMKVERNGDFHPNFTKGGTGYCRPLYRLYIMDGGARDVLLTDKSGDLKDKPMFWVPDVQRFKRNRFNDGGLRRMMRRGLRRAIRELDDPLNGVSYEYLECQLKENNCFGTHSYRHVFATYLVRQGHIQAAAKYLHHKGLKTLQEVYSGTTAAHYDVADILSEAGE